jgi:hypothetical protein
MAKTSGRKKAHVKKADKAKRATKRSRGSAKTQEAPPHEEDHIDGCDLEFPDSEATPDAELPEARGGVETVGRKRRAPP